MSDTRSTILIHIVFSTKNREPTIPAAWMTGLFAYARGIVREQRCGLVAIGGTEDHLHLLVRLRPAVAVAELVRRVKGASSWWLSRQLDRRAWRGWQAGYGAFTVGPNDVEAVRRYVENQRHTHARRDRAVGSGSGHEAARSR